MPNILELGEDEALLAVAAIGWQMLNSDIRYTGWDGGAPVTHRGQVVGAVAVSGLDQAEDAELARIGVARIAERLHGVGAA